LLHNTISWGNHHFLTQSGLIFSFVLFLGCTTEYLKQKRSFRFEPFIFFSLSQVGLILLLRANDLIIFFLSFELQAFSLYAIANLKKNSLVANEATLKYFVLGALFSSLILLGFSFLYGYFGTLNLIEMGFLITSNSSLLLVSLLLISFGLLFKLGAAPFRQWLPEVYEGVSKPATMFFSFYPKITLVLLLNNILNYFMFISAHEVYYLFNLTGSLSIFIGCIFALGQIKLKRLLAFSGIAQIGYLMMVVSGFSYSSVFALVVYLFFFIFLQPFYFDNFY
jgi:NADH-quinone oxidoreductase subunit N